MKAKELGRAPTQVDINKDKRLPGASTYTIHFGGLMSALEKIGLAPPFRFISEKEFRKELIRFHKRYKRVPTRKEFEKALDFPPLSILDKKRLTWNQILGECGLPIHSNKGPLSINRRAEIAMKKLLLSFNFRVDDLTAKYSRSPYSFKVDRRVRLHVAGATWQERGWKDSYLVWAFGIPDKKEFDYMVGVGFDDYMEVEAIYVFPVDILLYKSIYTPVFKENKYSKFRLHDFTHLRRIITDFTKEEEILPVNSR